MFIMNLGRRLQITFIIDYSSDLRQLEIFTRCCSYSLSNVFVCFALGNGHVYVWGDNSEGQLGLGEDVEEVAVPTKLQLNERAEHVACGYYHTAIVTGGYSESTQF